MNVKTISVSNQLSKMFKEKYEADVTTVENGIDSESFYPDPHEELIRIKSYRKAVLLLSRSDYTKGLDIAIKSLNTLSDEWKDKIEIWICGEEVNQEILNFKTIHFGWLGKERLKKVISSADVLFYPTRYEGFPLFPLEAMACGCPVVTTRAVPYVKDGENALVTEIEDSDNLRESLMNILNDELLREKLKKSGFETVSKHDLKESQGLFEKAIMETFSFRHYTSPDKLLKTSSK